MNSRRNQLAKVRAKHLEWIWAGHDQVVGVTVGRADPHDMDVTDDKNPMFVEWLQSDAPLFWISGKPASGKSTLMKYVSEHPLCVKLLGQATGQQWLTMHFFFDFRAHKGMANTVEGMLRSLLCQLVRFSRAVSRHIASTSLGQFLDVQFNELSQEDLQNALLSSIAAAETRICMFIDGLDEFEETYYSLIQVLRTLADGKCVKMCLASRPEPAIAQSLMEVPMIRMQDHNRGMIWAYIRDSLSKHADYIGSDSLHQMVENITTESNGVILWSQLVCSDVREGMFAREVFGELQARVANYPTDFDSVYDRLFRKMDARSKTESIMLLYVITTGTRYSSCWPLRTLASWFSMRGILPSFPQRNMSTHDFRLRLYSRIGAMVDIGEDMSENGGNIRLIHKTFETYLEKSKIFESEIPSAFRSVYPDHESFRFSLDIIRSSPILVQLALDSHIAATQNDASRATLDDSEDKIRSCDGVYTHAYNVCEAAGARGDECAKLTRVIGMYEYTQGFRAEVAEALAKGASTSMPFYGDSIPDEIVRLLYAHKHLLWDWPWWERQHHDPEFLVLSMELLMSDIIYLHVFDVRECLLRCHCTKFSREEKIAYLQGPPVERALFFALDHAAWHLVKSLSASLKEVGPACLRRCAIRANDSEFHYSSYREPRREFRAWLLQWLPAEEAEEWRAKWGMS